MSFTTAPRRRLAVLLVAVLTAALGGVVTQAAAAGKPAATGNSPAAIRIDRVYSNVPAPIGLPEGAAPNVIVQTGDEFFVQVTLLDARGKPASFDAPTPLTLTATSNNTGAVLPSWGVTVAKGQQTAVITGSISVATNQVVVTVSGAGLSKVATSENWFDVLSTRVSRAAATEQGIGGNDFCANATPDAPVCGTLLLPKLAESQVFMSLGACDATYAKCGNRLGGSIVQVLADLTAPNPNPNRDEIDLYTKTAPATLILKCDTSLCDTAAIQSIPVNFSLAGNGTLGPAPACPRKGTVGNNQDVCVDYVQSKRDGASDTILYLLFTRDLRGGIG
jgi:hypothetical protein